MFFNRKPMAKFVTLTFYSLLLLLVCASSQNDLGAAENAETEKEPTMHVEVSQDAEGIEAGSTPSLTCQFSEPGHIVWLSPGRNLTFVKESKEKVRLDLKPARRQDTGNYTCRAQTESGKLVDKTIGIRVIEPGRIEPGEKVRIKVLEEATLTCHIYGDPVNNFSWSKGNDSDNQGHLKDHMNVTRINETYVQLTLNFPSVTRKDNGTYNCHAQDYSKRSLSAEVHLFVIEVPQVSIDFMKAVGAGSIFLNWTVNNGNEPIKRYYIQNLKQGTDQWQYNKEQIGGGITSYVVNGLEKSTPYQIKISAENSVGKSHIQIDPRWITTLDEDPIFIPTVVMNGANENSITITWTTPPAHLKEHVHFYNLKATHKEENLETTYPAKPESYYAFMNLEPMTTYKFKVQACSEYTKQCGNWSAEINGTTYDGAASPPRNLSVTCRYDNISSTSFLTLSWESPEKPNGVIDRYGVNLTGISVYRNDLGRLEVDNWGPSDKNALGTARSYHFNQIPPNTNYTVILRGITRHRSTGKEASANCTMPPSVPDKDSLNLRTWRKIDYEGRKLFKLYLPRISERNGPICCYRVFMVKLNQQKTIADLPLPEDISVYSYNYIHSENSNGAYLAEMFDSKHLMTEVFLGNGESFNGSSECDKCIGLRPKPIPTELHFIPESSGGNSSITTSTTTTTTLSSVIGVSSPSAPEITTSVPIGFTGSPARRRRDEANGGDAVELQPFPPQDGFLDEKANYTGFIEVVVYGSKEGQVLTAYSSYFTPLYGGVEILTAAAEDTTTLGFILQISIFMVLLIVVLLVTLCIMVKYSKRSQQQGEEIITLTDSFRHLCRSLRGRHQLVAASPPDMPPVQKGELYQSFIDRHRNSDYGFQHEFELLPDKFTDRTTRASEMRENLYKNRYPDIKCYDQTRVRLTQIDGICGSDYINANFVLGYKERKKFICAQGPMENTVCDYWRMIWEQHLELVLMLTNLEEYSKTKCAKYWPDTSETKNFGDITVDHVRERAYSDYVVRELKMSRSGERESRTIVQYHFLVWKDFMAPEHPHAILKFIKRVNEAYSLEKGPILVHCSAGVGRTGTLVALDSLLQQLSDEGQVSIFNTVCDLRHQRNFLVQSLKQYIFIYRALMEMAQYGDTEIQASQMKAAVERLRQRENGKEMCRMEEEYEKIVAVLEDRKSFSVGGADENKGKNRDDSVIPYDRNRVILTPVPGREHSTYINASFIESYDNSESFIITQDPMESTIADFWRMISEHCISTIVMLSDLNEGYRKCPRYWPDDETMHDHIRVRYIQSESCPYYTRRELCVSNTKLDENIVVTQYQYHGWPTVEGEVPEVTRGLIELVNQTQSNGTENTGPLVVHCSCGSDRSSMFVALSILVQQLRTEKRIDIFTTTKKLRSQRHGMISSFAQYEFLHRAIVNYSDLHNLADDEPAS